MNEIPLTMKAAIINKYGGNEEVHIGSVDVPAYGDDDVLVQVKAASINPLDTRIRDGKMKQILPYTFPLTLGNDLAGVVAAVGANETEFAVGDEVYARNDTLRIGSFAEYAVVHSNNVAVKPANLSMEQAASVPLVALTVWQILVERANVQPGQKVLIHGGAGGVGSIAIQLAKHLGAYVAATVSEADFDKVKGYGADQVINYKSEDFSTLLSDYDLVLDTQGGQTLDKSLTVLKRGGSVLSINGTPDANMAKELGLNVVLKLAMTAFSYKTNAKAKKLGVHYGFHFMKPSGSQLSQLRALFESGVLHASIDKTYSFESVAEALAYSESGKSKGKIVVVI